MSATTSDETPERLGRLLDRAARALGESGEIQLIFETYDALRTGEWFVPVNDHGPKPLWYQFEFEAEHTGACR